MSRFNNDDLVMFLCLSFGDELKQAVLTSHYKHGIKALMLEKMSKILNVNRNYKELNELLAEAEDRTRNAMKKLAEEGIELDLWGNYDQIVDFNERHGNLSK